ncbi:MAG: helix-turn-helix domain-containing protein, partial [Devosiaceae bacterium]|nr:helix-turn-helix domain-containing protein [Devosiaceae bacterium]
MKNGATITHGTIITHGTTISIGELSRLTGVKVTTIRYYEHEGLLEAPERNEGNQRRYEDTHLQRLQFIRHARDLGLGMAAVRELVQLSVKPDHSCEEANKIATTHLSDVRNRIVRLRSL